MLLYLSTHIKGYIKLWVKNYMEILNKVVCEWWMITTCYISAYSYRRITDILILNLTVAFVISESHVFV